MREGRGQAVCDLSASSRLFSIQASKSFVFFMTTELKSNAASEMVRSI